MGHSQYKEGIDESADCWIDDGHVSAIIPYDKRMLDDDNRRDIFKGTIRKVIIENDWDYIGSEHSKDISYRIKLYTSRAGGSKYDMPLIKIGHSNYSRWYVEDFIKHYQRKADIINFYQMRIADNKNSPLLLTTDMNEWMFIIAPRINSEGDDKSFPMIFPKPKEFNPLTGEFE